VFLPSKERLLHSSILLHLCVLRIQAPIRRGLRLGRELPKNYDYTAGQTSLVMGDEKKHAECGRAVKACGLSGPWSSFFIVFIYGRTPRPRRSGFNLVQLGPTFLLCLFTDVRQTRLYGSHANGLVLYRTEGFRERTKKHVELSSQYKKEKPCVRTSPNTSV
jgi:hypothetical protein